MNQHLNRSVAGGFEQDTKRLESLLDRGEYFTAFDLCLRIIGGSAQPSIRKTKLVARCYSLLGMNDEAIRLLESAAPPESVADPEYHALLGGFFKRKWLSSSGGMPGTSSDYLEKSLKCYLMSSETGGGYWSSVNAATLAMLDGQIQLALRLSGEVIDACWSEYEKNGTASVFWIPASLGEAHLIRREYGRATEWFRAARGHLGSNYGWVASTRRNVKLLLEAAGAGERIEREVLDSIPALRVSVFAGHRFGNTSRGSPRSMHDSSSVLRQKIRGAISDRNIDMGIASAADGSDILFHECMAELGRSTIIVLPCPFDLFRSWMSDNAGPGWTGRFDAIVSSASRVETASISKPASEPSALYRFCSDFILGLSLDMVRQFDAKLIPFVVWNGRESPSGGGTSYMVSRLRNLGLQPFIIAPPPGSRMGAGPGLAKLRANEIDTHYVVICGVLRMDVDSIPDEEGAASQADISAALDEIAKVESVRISQCSTMPGLICFTATMPPDPGRFVGSLCERMSSLGIESMLIHAGLIVRTARSERGSGCFSRELAEAASIAGCGRIPAGFFCSLQAGSLMSIGDGDEFRLEYRGVFETDFRRGLRLFEIIQPGSPR